MMQAKVKMALHNTHEIIVRDVATGKVKQRAYAKNIILNGGLAAMGGLGRSFRNSGAFPQTHLGNGTGTFEATRTSLFNLVFRKNNEYLENGWADDVTCWGKVQMVVLPAEAVGETFTEIGLGGSSDTTLRTHAYIEDSEGNPISLGPKLDTEEITVFSTVYMKAISGSGVSIRVYEEHNASINGIIVNSTTAGGGLSNNYRCMAALDCMESHPLYCEKSHLSNLNAPLAPSSASSNVISSSNVTYDSENKRTVCGELRFEGSQGNGEIYSLYFNAPSTTQTLGSFIRINLAEWSGWPGMFVEKNFGTGDGSQTGWDFPFNEFDVDKAGNEIRVDGVLKTKGTDYTLNYYKGDIWLRASGKIIRVYETALRANPGSDAGSMRTQKYNALNEAANYVFFNGSGSFLTLETKYPTKVRNLKFRTATAGSHYSLEGSMDNSSWTTLLSDTHTSTAERTIAITDTGIYKFFRLGLTGGSDNIRLTHFDLQTATEPHIVFNTAPANSEPLTCKLWVDYIPKDTGYMIDTSAVLQWVDAGA